jgi:DMSO/TMAO reductase YedYZ molybdopterin-dependent catalytic subunit
LRVALEQAELSPTVTEIVVEGADSGYAADAGRETRYARSLTRAQALDPNILLAYAMNGEPLPIDHGFPVRLIVPGWYGMASVKWLSRIAAVSQPFVGFYQTERYIIERASQPGPRATPLNLMRVRSVIAEPTDGATVQTGVRSVRGFAWSGAGAIARVEMSADGGRTWTEARLTSPPERYAWRGWECQWRAASAGPATLISRAYDEVGNRQPDEAEWNALGYANNGLQSVHVIVS